MVDGAIEYILGLGGALVVGVDEELRRVYIGHRSKGVYFDDPVGLVDEAIAMWSQTDQHLIISRRDLEVLELKHD